LTNDEVYQKKGKYGVKTKFSVSDIGYNEEREINKLVIIDNKKTVRYELGKIMQNKPQDKPKQEKNNYKTDTTNNKNPPYKCSECDADINQAVYTYSTHKLGKALCRDCQNKYK
jgi:hypothetical protein